jgi:hypothetical protein
LGAFLENVVQEERKMMGITRMFLAGFVLMLISVQGIFAQNSWSFRVYPDTTRIKIGEQFSIRMEASVKSGEKVIFPLWKDSVIKGIDLISESKIDTLALNGSLLTIRRKWTLTSFDSGYYAIPALTARLASDFNDSLVSEAFLISVQTVKVDTTRAIKPIKGPLSPEFSFMEWWKEILIGLAALLLVIVLALFLRKRKSKKDQPVVFEEQINPSDWAMDRLYELKAADLIGKGLIKEYYVRLSEILRTYLEMQFGIAALESTTDEMIASLRLQGLSQDLLSKLKALLQLCDLVKFAKASPLYHEHEASFSSCMHFVESTKNNIKQPSAGNTL